MTLQDLLDELQGNVLRDVSDAIAGESDALWTQDTLVRYLQDGYVRFARHTLLLRESDDAKLTEVTLKEGVSTYSLDARVVGVTSAKLAGRRAMDATTTDKIEAQIDPQLGEPTQYTLDGSIGTIRFDPVPSADWAGRVVKLRVARLPKSKLSIDALDNELELPEEFHLDLVEWAAYRALRNHDADAENLTKAERHKARFLEAVEEGKDYARTLRFTPMQFAFRP